MADQYDSFQITGGASIGSDWKGGSDAPDMRPPNAKLSNFNAMYRGTRMSSDYTRTVLGFSVEENNAPVLGVGFGTDGAVYDYNPYVVGSTVKRLMDDQAHRMGMMHDLGASSDQPRMDVSDPWGMTVGSGVVVASFKNYPSEGYMSFGKFGDKTVPHAGNTWVQMPTVSGIVQD